MMNANKISAKELRKSFLNFWESKQHVIVPSAPMVVKNDPTLFFVNAGMNPFKDFFLGNKISPHPRIANTQKCLRVSGKHNDLEEVGVDHYHHTFFEMLGNWGFGDYFKTEVIPWAWEFLTVICKLPQDRLYATIFEGNEADKVEKDTEAFDIWKKYLPQERILLGNKKDNFWEMGDTGPCGPCSEIHFDMRTDEERKKIDGRDLVNRDHPEVIEIWNLVFIQFERKQNGSLFSLDLKCVDTGMGFERLLRVLNEKKSNYDTDLFSPIIQQVEKILGKKYQHSDSQADITFRVIADHIRAIVFAIADGQIPSNTGAGYIIRRILRRAIRYAYSFLECKEPLLFHLVDVLSENMKDTFPELQQVDYIKNIIYDEEKTFLQTLSAGLKRFQTLVEHNTNTKKISGEEVFELYDTYGFPFDLSRILAREHELQIDEKEFEVALESQRQRSRTATQQELGEWVIFLNENQTEFVGYEHFSCQTKILKYRSTVHKGRAFFQIVCQQTSFYAESGGQAGDTGEFILTSQPHHRIRIFNTIKENDTILHYAESAPTDEWKNQPILVQVDSSKRIQTQQHHSVTHLMHAALHKILGTQAQQKGCSLNEEKIRFDFAHGKPLTLEQTNEIEDLVNQKIRENILVEIIQLPKEEALKLGAMALFGEKYGDVVRTVIMDKTFSVELCGGTHVQRTGEIGLFKIISQSSVASGVRRVEALAGQAALKWVQEKIDEMTHVQQILKTSMSIPDFIEQQKNEVKELKKQNENIEAKLIAFEATHLITTHTHERDKISFVCSVYSSASSVKHIQLLNKFILQSDKHLSFSILVSNIEHKTYIQIQKQNDSPFDMDAFFKKNILNLPQTSGGGKGTQFMAVIENVLPEKAQEHIIHCVDECLTALK